MSVLVFLVGLYLVILLAILLELIRLPVFASFFEWVKYSVPCNLDYFLRISKGF